MAVRSCWLVMLTVCSCLADPLSADGFYFYPVYRVHGQIAAALGSDGGRSPRIYPDDKVHDWSLKFDPNAANGRGQIRVTLDEQSCTVALLADARPTGATFDRFGICTPWIDGNSVTVYFDDLVYGSPMDNLRRR